MADEDIYGSREKYSKNTKDIEAFSIPPEKRIKGKRGKMGKYFCKNPRNIAHFKRLFSSFEAKDQSYVRRLRLTNSLKLVAHSTGKDFSSLDRGDIDKVVAFMHGVYKSPKSKQDFIRDLKFLWKTLFPDKDEKGRPDETSMPYSVRHLSARQDRSRERRKEDRLSYEEFDRIVSYFSSDPRMQLFLMLSLESLGRPQEMLYTKIKDVELLDNYAKIYISSHGKEGTGLLQCIDSYPYLLKWLKVHPNARDKESYLFVNLGRTKKGKQLTPFNVNKKIRIACKDLGIEKPITAYSLKRNGVTFRRIRGDSDVEIQHTARWTSTKQLQTYDKSEQEDALRISLVKRGLLKDETYKQYEPKTRTCLFCNTSNGFTELLCNNCKRPMNPDEAREEYKRKELDFDVMKKELESMKSQMKEVMILKRLSRISPEALTKVVEVLEKIDKSTS